MDRILGAYWVCQFFSWTAYTLLTLVMIGTFGGSHQFEQVLYPVVVLAVLLGCFSHLLRVLIKKLHWITLGPWRFFTRMLLPVLLASLVIQLILYGLKHEQIGLDFLKYSGYVFLILSCWCIAYYVIKTFIKAKRIELDKARLERALKEAELTILRHQINPHFLFNALNNIRSLIRIDQDKARSLINSISDLLRYVRQFSQLDKVTLSKEIQITKDYLKLESVQLGSRMKVEFDIQESALGHYLPPMTVQLLVENAIKHGVSNNEKGGHIKIMAKRVNRDITISVINTGSLSSSNDSNGLGLKNMIKRMKILFDDTFDFKLEETSDNTVTATLRLGPTV